MPKILLDADDFDALHFSFLAHGGVGGVVTFLHPEGEPPAPHCVLGHSAWLEGHDTLGLREALATEMGQRLQDAGLGWRENDDATLRGQKEKGSIEKIDFETYITLLNIDIKE